jgi:hypothetical protein
MGSFVLPKILTNFLPDNFSGSQNKKERTGPKE